QICCQSHIHLSQSHAPPTPTPHQRTLSPFSSFWRRSKPHGATESTTQSRSRIFSWTRNLSGILRRREVEVPCTAGKPVRFFLFHSFSLLNLFRAEKLPRNREASSYLVSTSQHLYHTSF
ncbi:hypothetical protein P692DRAFT_20812629, partial [Suillus brevipes Sb2]